MRIPKKIRIKSNNLSDSDHKSYRVFDLLVEGVQIIDLNWNYVYVNKALLGYQNTTKEKLLGHSMLERFPGIESSEVFRALKQCMDERSPQRIETEFHYPDQTKKWFDLKIEPFDEGIIVLSIDITDRRVANDKIVKANHLHAFVSQVNQSILKIKDEGSLFYNSCHIAIEFGKFKMAWIGLFDFQNQTINLTDQSGVPKEVLGSFNNAPYHENGPQYHVLKYNTYYLSNDIDHDLNLESWKPFIIKYDVRSCMVLPIRKSGRIIGTFNLYSTELNFSGKEEIPILIEIADDISFALDLFEKEKKHAVTEELILKSEKQFRHTLDHMIEGIQIHDFNWEYIYVNEALVKYSTYTRNDLMGHTLTEKYPGIEQTDLFKTLERCMNSREAEKLETEFVFPNGSKAFFELSIQPIPEGIFILSVDRTEQKKVNEKLLEVNRMYAFNSAINQSIVHINEERELLETTCNVAIDIGQFKIAYIALLDESDILKITCLRGDEIAAGKILKLPGLDYNDQNLNHLPTVKVLKTGNYAFNNDMQNDPSMNHWKAVFEEHGLQSSISLPIIKLGKVIGIFGLHSSIKNFFDEEEIKLLEEASGDISFALELFEKAKKHKAVEELHINNENRFRALIEKSTDMKTLTSREGKFIYGSPSVSKVFGYSIEEFLDKPAVDFFHQDDLLDLAKNRAEILEIPGKSFSFQYRLLHKKGNWIWCEGTLTNMLQEPGINSFVTNFKDITERKIAEQQSEFDRNNLNALINNTSDLMWSVDRDFRLITFNQPFDAILRWTGIKIEKGDSVLSRSLSEEQSDRFKTRYERAFAGETFTEIEHNQSPVEHWMEISFCPIRKGEEIIGAACHSRNITERKRTEEQLGKSEAFNRGVLNSLSSHIAVVDGSGRIVAVNEAWKRFAFENGETTLARFGEGSNYFKVCEKSGSEGNKIAKEVLKGMKDVLNEKEPVFYIEYSCHSPDKDRWFSLRVLKFDSDEPMIVVAHQDITERKLAEKELMDNNEVLRKTNAELDRFVYSTSHDLRSPLTSILGLLYFIESESKEEETLTYAHMIRNSINRLDGFIKNILSYSRNNRTELDLLQIPLQKAVTDIVDSLRDMKDADGITFEVNIREDQPFFSDTYRFNTAVENIISNAIIYHNPRAQNRFIKITGNSDKDQLQLNVEDNGIGIPHKFQHKIFDMFFRIPNKKAGTGLGLYIVKEAIERLLGSISVASEEGVGTTFTIKFKNLSSQ